MVAGPTNEAALRLKAIADHLCVPVAAFYDDAGQQDPSLEELRQAYLAAAQAYTQGIRCRAEAVSLAEAG